MINITRVFQTVAAGALLSGCISHAPEAPTNWTIDLSRAAAVPAGECEFPESVRIGAVTVRQPYAQTHLAVLRDGGSVAFDGFNGFAGSPAALMRGVIVDALRASRRFGNVLSGDSVARARYLLECEVSVLALDCRNGRRDATVDMTVVLMDGRDIVSVHRAEGRTELGGDMSEAFSTAASKAIADCVGRMRPR